MLPTRDPPQKKIPTQTEREGLEKKYSKQMDRKAGVAILTYIRQNSFQNKGHQKRHRRTLDNTQGKNPSKTHKDYSHICTQNRSTQIYKEKLGEVQER